MAESLISILVEELGVFSAKWVAGEVKLFREVDAEVKKLTDNLRAIQAVLEDADKRQVQEATVKLWLEKLKDVAYDIDDVLDDWNTAALLRSENEQQGSGSALEKVRTSTLNPCFCFRQVDLRYKIAHRMKDLNGRLDAIATQKANYNFQHGSGSQEPRIITTSVLDLPEVYGREDDEKKIKDLLKSRNSEGSSLRIISLEGMGGLGKTTLARRAYNDAEVVSHFDKRIWVCVSNPFDDRRIAIEILESLGENTNLVGMNNILDKIREGISGKKILLILDDVWTEDSTRWVPLKDSLKSGSPEGRILITTRKEKVAVVMGATDRVPIGLLSSDACWTLFTHLAFCERPSRECENLEKIGREIVERCKGLPLAVKTVGSMLRFKSTEQQWQSVLDSEMWEIEDFEEKVFSALFVSYYDLPSILRQCFTYCAIFPEDYVIKKDKLIKLWMAQGFLNGRRHKEMEMVGEEYFKELAVRSFFQDFKKDKKGEIVECKMHDLVHNFAQFLMQKECSLVKVDDLQKPWKLNLPFKSIRHIMLMMGKGATFPIPRNDWKKVRSLLVESGRGNSKMEDNLLNSIDKLSCLRTLDLSLKFYSHDYTSIEVLTKKIGKLIHLRYLSLSNNKKIRILPESLCQLYNLQTLDVSGCDGLCQLLCDIGKLKSLRHLENEHTGLKFLPEGIKGLTGLRTVKEFIVGSIDDDESKSCSPCKLRDLGNLGQLQGSLTISGLQNVAEVNEATEARLSIKTGLRELILIFSPRGIRECQNEAAVVEALQPPPSLESLCVRWSNGSVLFPNWMTSLNMLTMVDLYWCLNWESLPPMGKLRFLESLTISGMKKVKKVGEEFLGIESGEEEGQTTFIAFPNLKDLSFVHMEEWEDWEYCGKVFRISIMPCLHSLIIMNCPKLNALPHHLFHKLQKFEIMGCRILRERFEKEKGEDWRYISHIPTVKI